MVLIKMMLLAVLYDVRSERELPRQSNILSVKWGGGSHALDVEVDATGFPLLGDLGDYRCHQLPGRLSEMTPAAS